MHKMQVILNDLKAEYPRAYKFLTMNIELRDNMFELAELAAIQDPEPRMGVARKKQMRKLCFNIERTFLMFEGE